ncbi:hypothetical protein DUI87_25354 [Hirundo rustica rustica]|uniref:Mitochondrial inner membrane protease subunit n=2 Tax=Neoaves TaxID=3078114 RepID=A0A3M0JSN9_HIRRU|nr:hypothetical protein DUI87_25354 [Hirundo rustica rustica]
MLRNALGKTFRFLGYTVQYGCIAHCAFEYLGGIVVCSGPSMEPTIQNSDIVFSENLSRHFYCIRKGDIVIVKSPNDPKSNICKRVIGLEGDKVCTSNPSDFLKSHSYYFTEEVSGVADTENEVLYHQEEEMYHFLEETILLRKREVMTGITIAMLLGLGATGTATGVSALVTQHQRLSQLQMTIDEDLLRIEKSISSLERSISSLSEVVLQNRRGLDLLLMQQGGLCAALREECCFYADHTGVVRDSMAELRGRLAQRKREREAQQGWFESWFNQSPWLATLVPTLIGPLTMILLTLIFGPCILNKLVSFVRRRLDKVDILFVERMQLS